MTSHRHHASGCLALALCLATLPAQDDPPPWWGIADENTVSLFWDFDNPAQPLVPTTAVLPSWYQAPANNGFTTSPNVVHLQNFLGQTGALGFTGPGVAAITTQIDNDPRPDWIKIFWMQFDCVESLSVRTVATIRQDLVKYERAIISEQTVSLGNGWARTTIGSYLIPQPEDESADFDLSETGTTGAAIDNLYVNSKCVKPAPDEAGDALGADDGSPLNVNLGITVANANIACAAATQNPTTTALTFWVAGAGAGNINEVFRVSATGVQLGTPIVLPNAPTAPLGPTDLAVAMLPSAVGTREFVVGVVDRRPSGGGIVLQAIDSQGAVFDPAQTRQIPVAAIGPGPLGLAFSPHGNLGQGTFWITDQLGNATEISLGGTVLRQLTPGANGTPAGIAGAAYDELTGNFYWLSNAMTPTPQGPVRVAGSVHSAYDFQPTGTKFFGDLRIPGATPGGNARGLDLIRLDSGEMRLLVVQRSMNQSFLRVLHGPYEFGWNLLGRCGMAGDPPMEGAPNFNVTLSGVPRASFATLRAGFNNTTFMGQMLPFSLVNFGLPESNISVAMPLSSPLLAVVNGEASFNLPLLPVGSGFSYVPMFFQWVVFDPSLPAGIATSQAGKTVIY